MYINGSRLLVDTNPEVFVEEAVDDWVDKAVRHGQPVRHIVGDDDEIAMMVALEVNHFWVEINDQCEQM